MHTHAWMHAPPNGGNRLLQRFEQDVGRVLGVRVGQVVQEQSKAAGSDGWRWGGRVDGQSRGWQPAVTSLLTRHEEHATLGVQRAQPPASRPSSSTHSKHLTEESEWKDWTAL